MTSHSRLGGHLARSRRLISDHRQNKRALERAGSIRSRAGLDWMNFFLADVQTGFGAFVAFYLARLGWSQVSVGFALTVGGLVGSVALLPGGALADAVRWKRALAAAGIVMIAGAALILALWPSFIPVVVAEVLHGLTAGIIGPAVAAISLGIVGRRGMSGRTGRNHRFQAAGTALTALLLGVLGSYVSNSMIFFATAALTIPALGALSFVRADEINYARARNAAAGAEAPGLHTLFALFKNTQLIWFACCAALFQFADASMLPLVSEQVGTGGGTRGSLIMSGYVVAPQIVVAILAPWIGYLSEVWGRKPVLMVGFGVQVLRGLLFAFVHDPIILIMVQLLDGISGAVLTVLMVVIVADLTAGTGRFNFASGAVGFVAAMAASASMLASGFIAQEIGHVAAFVAMAAVAGAGTLLVWGVLAETRPQKYDD